MLTILRERLRQKHRTASLPETQPVLPSRYRGRPVIATEHCAVDCQACVDACPTDAITFAPGARVDLGRCLYCGACETDCSSGAIHFTQEYRMATRTRDALIVDEARTYALAEALDKKSRRIFGRSLKLRQVSAGGCNACESELNVLGTLVWDLGRFGVQFVASPRHADAVVVTGPVTRHMVLALRKTYDAIPAPKFVIAVGACAISGGPYIGHEECRDGADSQLTVDLYIPGCPPHPATILDGLLRLMGRIEN